MRPQLAVLGTIFAGFAAVVVAVLEVARDAPTSLALLAAAAIAAELFEDWDAPRGREPIHTPPLRAASGVYIAAVLVLGPWPAVIVAATGVLVVKALRSRDWRRVCFDASAYVLATLAGGYAFLVAGGSPTGLALLEDLVPVAAAAVAYLTVRTVLLDVVYGREPFQPDVRTGAGEAGLGTAIALFAGTNPWNMLALVPILLAIHAAHVRLARVRHETLHALETFANIVDEREPSTYQHSARVSRYVDTLARSLGLPFSDIDRLRWAGRLHDLGKVAVDAAVLKKEGRLDAAEWAAVHRHPRLSARLLQRFEIVAPQARAVEYHHERFDGGGYYGVAGDDLPLASHFLIVADAFDAMTTDRPFRPRATREQALAEIERNSGTQFHPVIAKAFVAVQRGQDPMAILTPDELAEIHAAVIPHPLGSLRRARDLQGSAELMLLAGISLALIGPAIEQVGIALVGVVLAIVGVTSRTIRRLRVERMARRVLEVVARSDTRAAAFDGVVDLLERTCGAHWAALVAWHEDGLGGAVEWERGDGGPATSALTSWLVREAQAGDDIVVAAPFELSTESAVVALPLRRDNTMLAGFLVLASPRALPSHVELALRPCLDALGLALVREPGAAAGPPPRVNLKIAT